MIIIIKIIIIIILNKNRKKYLENYRFGDKLMCGISFYGKLIYPWN